ncbi:TPA: winged helix-turn-helix transcriptional regulator [Candidatus Woesearchaeota archaeon]|nr:winged helix-turn-helix transcriptional regulator [Candidatus Woesearchaeota archaeon]
MNNKKIGGIVLGCSIILLIIFIAIILSLQKEAKQLGCYSQPGCTTIDSSLTIVHFAFGFFGFLLALGIYLIFFSTSEEAIVRRLEQDSTRKLEEDTFSILLKGLDTFEREVIQIIKKEPGITQNTLRLKVNMSKAKLSQVLLELDKKGLLTRQEHKKTYKLYLK